MSSIILFYASVFRSVVDSTKTIRHLERLVWVYVISSALYGPPTTLRLSPFSCILVALGNSLLHSNFLFSVRAEKFCRCTPMQRWFANFSRCACIYILPRAREYWRSRDFGTKEHLCAHRSFTRIIDSSSEAEWMASSACVQIWIITRFGKQAWIWVSLFQGMKCSFTGN